MPAVRIRRRGHTGSAARWRRDEHGFGLIEAVVALTLFAIGLVAVASLSVAVARQTRLASWQTEQAFAGQEALERVHAGGYAQAVGGSDSISVGGHMYYVAVTVADLTPRIRRVQARVPAVGNINARTFTTHLYRPRPLPAGP